MPVTAPYSQIKLQRSDTTGAAPGAGAASDFGEVSANVTDRKLFMLDATGAPVTIADRILTFDPARNYATDDIVVRNGFMWQAKAAIPAGAFDASDWNQIGATAAQEAVLTEPDSAERNTIDLTGIPSHKGLVIKGDPAQLVNLLEIPGTAAADTRSAIVDPQGFPNSRFGPSIFRVVQATHPFGYRGQAVAHNGSAWVLANANDPALPVIAVIEQIIDANTFVLRTGGRIEQLQTGSFAGGTIVAGSTYYVSDTVPGQLTTTISAVRPDPVLRAISATTGVLLVGAGAASSDYVSLTGDTMTGPLTLATGAELRFEDEFTSIYKNAASPSILFEVSGAVAGRVDENATDAADATTLMTRLKGDNRYFRFRNLVYDLSWGGLDGEQHWFTDNDGAGNANIRFGQKYDGATVATAANSGGVHLKATIDGVAGTFAVDLYSAAALAGGVQTLVASAQFDYAAATDLPSSMSVVTRARGDARYIQETERSELANEAFDLIYPIGSLYLSAVNVTPARGTWVPYAEGRAVVGVGSADGLAWTGGQTRGAATVTLDISHLPSHVHNVNPPNTATTSDTHNHGGATGVDNARHNHQITSGWSQVDQETSGNTNFVLLRNGATGIGQGQPQYNYAADAPHAHTIASYAHSHNVNIAPFDSAATGGGEAHDNIQPSIGVYVWRRTA